MSKRVLIPLAAIALVCGGTVAVAHAATSGGSTRATCTSRPTVIDKGESQQFTVTCSVPKAPGGTVTSTVTQTVTATATGTESPSEAPTDPPYDLRGRRPKTSDQRRRLRRRPRPRSPP